MTGWIRLPQLVAPSTAIAFFLGTASVLAQTVSPDEAVNASGTVTQQLALTEAQKNAIYKAVMARRARGSDIRIPVAIGAPVSPAVELTELPDEATADVRLATDLKYAMVENEVVVVDPIRMRVVDIIRGSAKP